MPQRDDLRRHISGIYILVWYTQNSFLYLTCRETRNSYALAIDKYLSKESHESRRIAFFQLFGGAIIAFYMH
jgi:hypothetical protein